MSASATAPAALPIYALYGEPGHDPGFDRMHCETIAQRSRLHGGEIRPHRHEHLFQILHLERGRMRAWLDAQAVSGAACDWREGPAVVCLPPLAPHAFHFCEQAQGTVITMLEPHFEHLLAAAPLLRDRLRAVHEIRWHPDDPRHVEFSTLVHQIGHEYRDDRPHRSSALDALLLSLLVMLGRACGRAPPPAPEPLQRSQRHVHRLRRLVEARFRQQPTLAQLARELGLSTTHLNRACQAVLGHTALAVLHRRLLLEAQRELAYTREPVKQIAWNLGFADAGYFARFFRRLTGHTPTQWRQGLRHRRGGATDTGDTGDTAAAAMCR